MKLKTLSWYPCVRFVSLLLFAMRFTDTITIPSWNFNNFVKGPA